MFLVDAASVQRCKPFCRKGVGIQGNERVLGAMGLQSMIEGEQSREVGSVCDESRPDFLRVDHTCLVRIGIIERFRL